MRRRAAAVGIALVLSSGVSAGDGAPGCPPKGSPRYRLLPYPYPQTELEVIADFEHCYLDLYEADLVWRLVHGWRNVIRRLAGIRGRSGPSGEEVHIAKLIRRREVRYEVLRFEDWQDRRRPRVEGPREGYLVRLFAADSPRTEIARWVLAEDGSWRWGQTYPLDGDGDSMSAAAPGALPTIEEARRRLQGRWGTVDDLRYVVYAHGPVGRIRECIEVARPCLGFTADGERFLYSPEAERLFRLRSELGTLRVDARDEVSILESQLSIARVIDVERDLVIGIGDEIAAAREIAGELAPGEPPGS